MHHKNQISTERQPRSPHKRMTLKQATAPYLERLAALNARREADRKSLSINWTGKEKE